MTARQPWSRSTPILAKARCTTPASGRPMPLAGPLSDLRLCPTGGITEATAVEFLAQPNVVCIGGSWMVDKAWIDAGAGTRSATAPRRPRRWSRPRAAEITAAARTPRVAFSSLAAGPPAIALHSGMCPHPGICRARHASAHCASFRTVVRDAVDDAAPNSYAIDTVDCVRSARSGSPQNGDGR